MTYVIVSDRLASENFSKPGVDLTAQLICASAFAYEKKQVIS